MKGRHPQPSSPIGHILKLPPQPCAVPLALAKRIYSNAPQHMDIYMMYLYVCVCVNVSRCIYTMFHVYYYNRTYIQNNMQITCVLHVKYIHANYCLSIYVNEYYNIHVPSHLEIEKIWR